VKDVWRALTERLPWYDIFVTGSQVVPDRVYPHEIANKRIGLAALDLLTAMMTFSTGAFEPALLPIGSVEGAATNHLVLPIGKGQQQAGGVNAPLYGGEVYQAAVSPIAPLDFVGYSVQQRINVAEVLDAEERQFHPGLRGLWSGRDIGSPGKKVLAGTVLFLAGLEPTFVERWQAEELVTNVTAPSDYIDLAAYKQALGNRDNLIAVSQDVTGFLSFAGVMIQAMRGATLGGGTNPFSGYTFMKIGAGMNRLYPMQSTKISIGYAHDVVWPLFRPLIKPREI
jgi:hypothetical protein